jgi:hypothetical protein
MREDSRRCRAITSNLIRFLCNVLDKPEKGIETFVPVPWHNMNTYRAPRFSNLSFKVIALATVTPSGGEHE